MRALDLVLDGKDGSVKVITAKAQDISFKVEPKYARMLQKFPNLLKDDIGCFPDYVHTIVLKAEAKPTVRRSKPIPLSMRDKTIEACKQMEIDRVWSKVDRSDRIHKLVRVLNQMVKFASPPICKT